MTAVTKPHRRSRLLPSLGVLALIDLFIFSMPRWRIIVPIGFLAAMVYLAYVVVVTKDIAVDVSNQCPFDRWLCKWSGPIALMTAVGLFVAVTGTQTGAELEDTWIGSMSGMLLIKFTMEVGLVMGVACWCYPRKLGSKTVFFWRALVVPLVLIYGSYLVLLPIAQLVGDRLEDRENSASDSCQLCGDAMA